MTLSLFKFKKKREKRQRKGVPPVQLMTQDLTAVALKKRNGSDYLKEFF